jgi:DNA polymerase
MSRRRAILEEIGIAPLWRLRARAAEPQRCAGVAGAPAPERRANYTTAPGGAGAAPEETRTARGQTEPAPQGDPRRQQIARMDWHALEASVAQCVACPLHAKRTHTVFGVGDERAEWLFVGEGPGAEEDAKGEPFVGQAGRLLDNMLAAIDLARGNGVYIANVVKCRPPNNRNPEPREMGCCEPYLARQIALIQPKLIVALGKTAANHLLETDASIASLRGRLHAYRGIPLIVTYHPAYLLRSLQEKAKAWVDLCFARETMAAIRTGASPAPR